MTYVQDQIAARASLAEAGQPVTLTPRGTGTYDPATGTVSGASGDPVITVGAVFPLSLGVRGFRYGMSAVAGTDILLSDQQLLLPGDIDEPGVGDIAHVNGSDFSIIAVSPINPAGTAVLYDCVIRGV